MQSRYVVAAATGSYHLVLVGIQEELQELVLFWGFLGLLEQRTRSYPTLGTGFVRLSQPCRVAPSHLKKFGYKIVGFQWLYHIPAVLADFSHCPSPHAPSPFLLMPIHLGHSLLTFLLARSTSHAFLRNPSQWPLSRLLASTSTLS